MSLFELWVMGLGGMVAGVGIGMLAVQIKLRASRSRAAQSAQPAYHLHLAGEVI